MLSFLETRGVRSRSASSKGYEKQKLSSHISLHRGHPGAQSEALEDGWLHRETHSPDRENPRRWRPQRQLCRRKEEAMTDILIAALITGLTNVVTFTIDELSTPCAVSPATRERPHLYPRHRPQRKLRRRSRRQDPREHPHRPHAPGGAHRRAPQGRAGRQRHDVRQHHDHVFPRGRRNPPRSRAPRHPSSSWRDDNCKLNLAGRYIRLPYHGTEGHKTIGNWYTTLLNAHGNPIKHYGDLDLEMSRKKLDQSGAIKQFMA